MAAIAASAASLTGLLFVALSVAPRRDKQEGPAIVQEVRAAAALLAFVNALAVALFSLVPNTNIGYPAAILGVIGLLFTAASLRSIFASRATMGLRRRQTGLIILLLLIFGTELVNGVAAVARPHAVNPVEIISYALVTSVLVGIARAWELVGDRDTGIVASIAILTRHGHPPAPLNPAEPPAAQAAQAGVPPGGGAGARGPEAPGPEAPGSGGR
jgi:hypothetical protein